MLTIDAQVHAYERNRSDRPWVGVLQGPPEVTGDQITATMDAFGVDGAILVSPSSLYRYDASWAPRGTCGRSTPNGTTSRQTTTAGCGPGVLGRYRSPSAGPCEVE